MIQVFKTDEDYKKWLNGQTLPSGIVVYVSDNETMYFSTNNIKGELKTYKCEKEEPIQYPPLIYSAKSAGSTITVNGETMTLEQGDNITLEYPTEITSVEAMSNTALTAIQIPNTVTSIGDNAFNDCTALGSVTLPNSLSSIGQAAFSQCTALGSVTLPNSLISIGDSAFNSCSSLVSITIPNSVTSIDGYAFANCSKLTDFNYNGTTAQWASITLGTDWKYNAAFTVVHCTDGDVSLEEPIQPIQPNNLVYSTNAAGSTITVNGETVTLEQGENIVLEYPNEITSVAATNNTALTYIQIPNTVTSIGTRAFWQCAALVSVNIPESVKSIGKQAFRQCTALASVNIPESVKSIAIDTFNSCKSLLSITIPNSVTSIDGYAFYDCSKLTDFNYNGTTAQWASITLGTNWKNNAAFTVVHCTDGDVTL